jgi:hypothetical protein
MYAPDNLEQESPIIVGGFPGSGTRVAVWMLMASDVYMGPADYFKHAYESYDSMAIANWVGWWIIEWITMMQIDRSAMDRGLDYAIDYHMTHRTDETLWGWKNPPNQLLIDYYYQRFPNMKYIHVIRDGRDLNPIWAGSLDYAAYIQRMLVDKEDWPVEERLMFVWNALNSITLKVADKILLGRYLTVRLEDLVAQPEMSLKRIADFVGTEGDLDKLPQVIKAPPSIGRYKKYSKEKRRKMTSLGFDMLERFGYNLY